MRGQESEDPHRRERKFTVKKNFKDALSRQLGEAIAIYKSKDSLLNSKNEYVTNCISRISVQEGAIERKLRDRREEEEEKAQELKVLEFKKRKLEARAVLGDAEVNGKTEERMTDGMTKLANLRRKMELEKTEVLKKMSNKKQQKDKISSGSLSANSLRTAHYEMYRATPTRQKTISGVLGTEVGVSTSTFLSNNTPSQPVLNLNVGSGSKRKFLNTFQVGNDESDSPRKRFKRILNFWDTSTNQNLTQ